MKTTRVFWSGKSQAVRIPKEFLIETDEVEIQKKGDTILLKPRVRPWKQLFQSLSKFTDDFTDEKPLQPPMQKRAKAFR